MEIDLFVIACTCAAFFTAGIVDAIAGGGGLITMPALLLTGMPSHCVLGTGKFSSTLGSLSATWSYWKRGLVSMKIAPLGFASSFIGSAFGSWLALQIDAAVLGRVLVFLLPVGLAVSLASGRLTDTDEPLAEKGFYPKVLAIGFVIGAYDGFFGPGAGSFFIIAQHLMLRLGLVKASATAKVFNLASNLGGVATFAAGGVVLYGVAIPCAVASMCGNLIGVRLAVKLGAKAVRSFLYVVLTLLLATLIYRFFIAG